MFDNLDEVREVSQEFVDDYNNHRPHDAMGGISPRKYQELMTEGSNPFEGLRLRYTTPFKGIVQLEKNCLLLKYTKNGKPTPALLIAKSYAGTTVLTNIIIDKYVNHLPFYRQIEMFKQQGISITPATINGWFQDMADLLRPTYYRLKELVLDSDYIQSDETTIPIINNEKHTTIKGYIWMIWAVMDNLVFFHYDHGSRAQKVALQLFKDFQGVIQTDGYTVYDIYENKKGVLPIGCWAHARRKFEEAL